MGGPSLKRSGGDFARPIAVPCSSAMRPSISYALEQDRSSDLAGSGHQGDPKRSMERPDRLRLLLRWSPQAFAGSCFKRDHAAGPNRSQELHPWVRGDARTVEPTVGYLARGDSHGDFISAA